MSTERPTTQDLIDEMRQLHEGVGMAKEKLAQVTEYLGVATKGLQPPTDSAQPPSTPPAEESEQEPR